MIDINKFCDSDSDREILKEPFLSGDNIYATNGHILFCGIGIAKEFFGIKPAMDKHKGLLNLYQSLKGMQVLELVTMQEIGEALNLIQPRKKLIYETKKERCPKCRGRGDIDCECDDCGDVHQKECPECEGKLFINIEDEDKVIKEDIILTPTPLRDVYLNWKYLNLIKEVMMDRQGDWQMKLQKENPCIFKTTDILIIVMPMKP